MTAACLEAGVAVRDLHLSPPGDAIPIALDRLHGAALVDSIDTGAVHVWRVALDDAMPGALDCYLTPGDHQRAARYVKPLDRTRRLHARGALRALLERYAGVPGGLLDLSADGNGKPGLPLHHRLHCNLSHAGGDALIAIGREALGVDLEPVHVPSDLLALAREVMSALELHAFERLPPDARASAFLTCWTRKEACLKALGTGLLQDPREVDVGIMPVRRTVSCGAVQVDVQSLDDQSGHVLALAVVRDARNIGAPAGPVLRGRFLPGKARC